MKKVAAGEAARNIKIIPDYRCNNHCQFCYDLSKRGLIAKSPKLIAREIGWALRHGARKLIFIGGETTLRDDLLDHIHYARRNGIPEVVLITNGRRLAYEAYAQALQAAGLTYVVFSLHGPSASVHDRLTGVPGSYNQLRQGIDHIRRLGVPWRTNTTIVRGNYKVLPELARWLAGFPGIESEFIWFCGAPRETLLLSPRVRDALPYVKALLDIGKAHKLPWQIQNFPLPCPWEDAGSMFGLAGNKEFLADIDDPLARRYRRLEAKKVIHWVYRPACRRCCRFSTCRGVRKDYIQAFGDKEVVPVKPPVS